jgi:hypothetical protein
MQTIDRIELMKMLKRLGKQFLGTAVLFSALVGLGTSIVLLFASCIGYLSYSDRPGPGWWAHVHWPSLAEIGNYLGFAPWFAYFCLYFGVGLFVFGLVLGFAITPRWLNRFLGGIIAALAAGLAVAGAGWYFALAAIGPDTAIVIGLLYGVFLFPRFVHRNEIRSQLWLRVIVVIFATGLFLFWIARPFLPRKPIPSVALQIDRLTPSDKPFAMSDDRFLGPEISSEVASLNLSGELHGGIGQAGGGNSQQTVSVLLIALEPITQQYKLDIPETGYVVYLLKNHVWTAHPGFQKKDKRSVILKPGVDPHCEGGEFKFGDAKEFSRFTWYPTIPLMSR